MSKPSKKSKSGKHAGKSSKKDNLLYGMDFNEALKKLVSSPKQKKAGK